jgi:hypothetical protein
MTDTFVGTLVFVRRTPSQWTTRPMSFSKGSTASARSPTKKTSSDALPPTATRFVGRMASEPSDVSFVPFQCRIVSPPTANTSLALVPQTPSSSCVSSAGTVVVFGNGMAFHPKVEHPSKLGAHSDEHPSSPRS